MSKPSIAIIGPGRLGRSLVRSLAKSGYPIREIIFSNPKSLRSQARNFPHDRHIRSVILKNARLDADIIWLCVPDSQIQSTAMSLKSRVPWKNKIVFHSSGALTSDALQVLREQGASVASVHPLMTFVSRSQPSLKGAPFGLEGDKSAVKAAREVVTDLGGTAFLVKKQNKEMYHAWGTFLSPLLLAYMATTEQVGRAAGVSAKEARRKMLPIALQTLSNYASLGAKSSFSGPLVRGDVEIVREHLKALSRIPEARAAYIVLAKSALLHLPVRNRKALEKLLR